MTERIGTAGWARRTGGNLTARQQVRMTGSVLSRIGPLVAGRVAAALGRRPSGAVAAALAPLLSPPDTPWAAAALERAAAQPPGVTAHALRTYCYGGVLAAADGVGLDVEAFFIASLLHDLALPQAVAGTCFTVPSAQACVDAARAAGVDEARAEAAAAGVIGHVTPAITVDSHGAIAVYVQDGAMLDLTGARRHEVSAATVGAVLGVHPAADGHAVIAAAMRATATAAPRTRMAVLRRCGLPEMIRLAPREVRGA
jgi:hypothetical protein